MDLPTSKEHLLPWKKDKRDKKNFATLKDDKSY